MKVLVLEDDTMFLDTIKMAFADEDEFTLVTSVADAKTAYDAGSFDIVMLDYYLDRGQPGTAPYGMEMAEHIAANPKPDLLAMIHTGNSHKAQDMDAVLKAANVDTFVMSFDLYNYKKKVKEHRAQLNA